MNRAIYNPVTSDEDVQKQETLIYNLKDGFAWVRTEKDRGNTWHCFNPTAVGAEEEARRAGFAPPAIFYAKV